MADWATAGLAQAGSRPGALLRIRKVCDKRQPTRVDKRLLISIEPAMGSRQPPVTRLPRHVVGVTRPDHPSMRCGSAFCRELD